MKKLSFVLVAGGLLLFAGKAYAHYGVPEIDAGSAAAAVGVLSGAIALAAERLRRK